MFVAIQAGDGKSFHDEVVEQLPEDLKVCRCPLVKRYMHSFIINECTNVCSCSRDFSTKKCQGGILKFSTL